MQIEHANLLGEDNRSNGLDTGAIIRLFILAMFDKAPSQNVLFKLQPRNEMVVLAIDLIRSLWPRCVCKRKENVFLDILLKALSRLEALFWA